MLDYASKSSANVETLDLGKDVYDVFQVYREQVIEGKYGTYLAFIGQKGTKNVTLTDEALSLIDDILDDESKDENDLFEFVFDKLVFKTGENEDGRWFRLAAPNETNAKVLATRDITPSKQDKPVAKGNSRSRAGRAG